MRRDTAELIYAVLMLPVAVVITAVLLLGAITLLAVAAPFCVIHIALSIAEAIAEP